MPLGRRIVAIVVPLVVAVEEADMLSRETPASGSLSLILRCQNAETLATRRRSHDKEVLRGSEEDEIPRASHELPRCIADAGTADARSLTTDKAHASLITFNSSAVARPGRLGRGQRATAARLISPLLKPHPLGVETNAAGYRAGLRSGRRKPFQESERHVCCTGGRTDRPQSGGGRLSDRSAEAYATNATCA